MDDEFDEMEQQYFERQAAQEQQLRAEGHPMTVEGQDGMPQDYYDPEPAMAQQQYYPLSLAQGVIPGATPAAVTTPEATAGSLLTNRYAGVPVWGWGLIGIGVLGGGYLLFKNGVKSKKNDGGEDDDDDGRASRALPASTESSSGSWSPSRSAFGEQLTKFVSRRGLPMKDIKIYTDADEAKKYCKPCSPLVTVKCSTGVTLPMADLEKFASKEGLTATDHGSGVVGFYPRPNGKRGKEWEEYVDALRDEGQSI